ncbi:NAD(P)/FAD-dependent oxidoreductase [Thalassobacillus sp. CUG 92003]|uniref:NAD(P)/FAD-dependent oxidoreductase n=1 Tax=Thalassobacillus sp. CUG 92003 TaxID=2736641 RepID=UPI0015E691DB|nr:NAD(P)-binding protein [Thalassobacillus sp. CUG 92003]
MNIAIIGAGLAGLSCALTLEKHGHSADIFEQSKTIGFKLRIAELMTPVLHAPINDVVQFFSEHHDIHLKPTSSVQKIHVHSPHASSFVEGKLGFINMRGDHPEAYEKQLAEQLVHSKIHYNQHVSYEEVAKAYTHVVVATGDPMDTEKFQPFDTAFKSTFAGAIVSGDFKRNEVHTWFDTTFAPKGMAYLLPHSESQGTLVVVYPQYEDTLKQDPDKLWKATLAHASETLNQTIVIEDAFSIKDYIVGKSAYPRIGNTFFVGNCFGAITPFLGFGQTGSILSGIYAAQDMCGLGQYEELTQSLYQDYHDSLTLRRAIERLSNHQLDLVTKSLRIKAVENAITEPNMNVLKLISRIIHPFSRKST